MRKLVMTAALALSVSAGAIAYAQVKDEPMVGTRAAPMDSGAPPAPRTELGPETPINAADARSLASDAAVGDARRYYRNQCNQYESPGFCECVTAGVAQALMPEEVRIAGRTIGERINAQGDAAYSSQSDAGVAMSSAERIEQVEGHYADACSQFRG